MHKSFTDPQSNEWMLKNSQLDPLPQINILMTKHQIFGQKWVRMRTFQYSLYLKFDYFFCEFRVIFGKNEGFSILKA